MSNPKLSKEPISLKQNDIAVCLASDINYIQHLAVTMASILKNAKKKDNIKFYIISDEINTANKNKISDLKKIHSFKITYIKPNKELLKNCNLAKHTHITSATYYRLLIPEIIPEDKVIYLDSDIVVRSSLSELYNKYFKGNYILGIKDFFSTDACKRLNLPKYINTGVLLLNSKQMRKDNITSKMLKSAENPEQELRQNDQDIINITLSGKIDYLDPKWNTQTILNSYGPFCNVKNPNIVHFISSKKPWTSLKPLNSSHWNKEYFKYLQYTKWANFTWKHKLKSILLFPLNLLYPTGKATWLIKKIFSIRNTPDLKFKVITILGIKMKMKRNKHKTSI